MNIHLTFADNDFAFNYARSVLDLNQADFGAFNGISLGVSFILVIPGIFVVQRLKVSHPTVISVGSMFFVMKFACLTLSEFAAVFYYIREFFSSNFRILVQNLQQRES